MLFGDFKSEGGISMGSKTVWLLGMFFALYVRAAPVPPDYAMECRMMPYRSNSLSVRAIEGQVLFNAHNNGGNLEAYKGLLELPSGTFWSWGASEVSFSFPLDKCALDTEDARIISCYSSEELSVGINLYPGSGDIGDRKSVQVVRPGVRLRKVRQVGPASDFLFELAVGRWLIPYLWEPLLILGFESWGDNGTCRIAK